MKDLRMISMLIFLSALPLTASAQKTDVQNATLVGGPCEGCEAVLDYGSRNLMPVDTLPGFAENEPKIKVTGIIYKSDGVTPAGGVVLFVHHTNREGIYPKRGDEKGWERQYGYIHGWVKTGADGRYAFYTFRPGSYNRSPAHIHPLILEPDGKYYWLGSFFFADDPLLRKEHRNPEAPRGGSSGVLKLEMSDQEGLLVGRRDFILGKNVQGYE